MQLGSIEIQLADGVPMRRPQPFHACERRRGSVRPALLALCWLALLALAPAHGAARPDLFNTDNLPAGDGATTELGAKRARFIRVNAPVLLAADSPLHQPAPANLNLDSSRLELG